MRNPRDALLALSPTLFHNRSHAVAAASLLLSGMLIALPALADKPQYKYRITSDDPWMATIPEAFQHYYTRVGGYGTGSCGIAEIERIAGEGSPGIVYFAQLRATWNWTVGDYTCPGALNRNFVPFLKIDIIDVYHSKNACPRSGNPIAPLVGSKTESISIDTGLSSPLTLAYDTSRKLPGNAATFDIRSAPSFGELWDGSWHRRLAIYQNPYNRSIQASRGAGRWVTFYGHPTPMPDTETNDRLTLVAGNYAYIDAQERSVETYSAEGALTEAKFADGRILRFTYSDSSTPITIAPIAGLLIKVRDEREREVQFSYSAAPHITSITSPGNRVTSFAYDAQGRLERITWPDASTRQLKYERADVPWALTGQIDEQGIGSGTYEYDNEGRAISTEGAGGVNRFSVTYTAPPRWEITEVFDSSTSVIRRDHRLRPPVGTKLTDPSGAVISMDATTLLGSPRLTRQSQPAGSGCGPASSLQAYDANVNVVERDDFTGLRTCYSHDQARNLETSRVEGLANTQACSTVVPANAALPSGSRKTSTTWHPHWRLAIKIAEPRRLTTHIYNGQPDPFDSHAIANCAPASTNLPDGKSIAVLCKTVEQATHDASGATGFGAALDTSVPNRVWSYTYNEFGQILTSRDPRGNTTTNVYYTSTTADYTRGDLEKTTNALNQTTRFTKYNPMGQVLQSIDANNVVTDYEYDLRQRLKSQTTAGQSTIYAYTLTGLLERVSQPDGSYVGYEYDPAQRLVAVKDNLGNRIEYTLDNSGQRREERIKDPSGMLKGQVSRIFDVLGRTQQVTGRE